MSYTNIFLSSLFITDTENILNQFLQTELSAAKIKITPENIYLYPDEPVFTNKILYFVPVFIKNTGSLFFYGFPEPAAKFIDNLPDNCNNTSTGVSLNKTVRDIVEIVMDIFRQVSGKDIDFKIGNSVLNDITSVLKSGFYIFKYRLNMPGIIDENFYLIFEAEGLLTFINYLFSKKINKGELDKFLKHDYNDNKYFDLLFNFKSVIEGSSDKELQFLFNLLIRNGLHLRYFALMNYLYFNSEDTVILRNLSKSNFEKTLSIYRNNYVRYTRTDNNTLEDNLNLKLKPVMFRLIRERQLKDNISKILLKLFRDYTVMKFEKITEKKSFPEWINDGLKSKNKKELIKKLVSEKYKFVLKDFPVKIIKIIFSDSSRDINSIIEDIRIKSNLAVYFDIIKAKYELIEFVKIITDNKKYFRYYNDKFETYIKQLKDDFAIQTIIKLTDYNDIVNCFADYPNLDIINFIKKNMSRNLKTEFEEDLNLKKGRVPIKQKLISKKKIVELVEQLIENGKFIMEII